MKIPELLAPVGGRPHLTAAIQAGADAVYFGVIGDNMRGKSKNFPRDELKHIIAYCHDNNVKVYITINSLIHEVELPHIRNLLNTVQQAQADAVIAWDSAVINEANKLGNMPLHLSTQASVANSAAAEFYHKQCNVERIVLARECTLAQIREIKKKLPTLEIETFIHGAMCMATSGRCFLSQDDFGKSANKGVCIQPCRREFIVKDVDNEIEYKLENNHIFSMKDLCTVPFIEKLIEAQIDCFKIEGRNRPPEYVKIVTEVYREALNRYKQQDLTPKVKNTLMKKLSLVYNREFYEGYFMGQKIARWQSAYSGSATQKVKCDLGRVINYYKEPQAAALEITGHELRKGDEILVIGNKTGAVTLMVNEIQKERKQVTSVTKGAIVSIKSEIILREGDKVYVFKKRV